MCERLSVSRARYYAPRARQATPTTRIVADVGLTATIRTVDAVSPGAYGVPRVTTECSLGLDGRSSASVSPSRWPLQAIRSSLNAQGSGVQIRTR